jgi:hypothetical protein
MGAEHVFIPDKSVLEHVQGLREKRGKTGTLSDPRDPIPRHCTVSQQPQSPTLSEDTDKLLVKKTSSLLRSKLCSHRANTHLAWSLFQRICCTTFPG